MAPRSLVVSREASWSTREIVWSYDGAEVASRVSGEETVVLRPAEGAGVGLGAVRVVHSALSSPRRAIWFEGKDVRGRDAEAAAHVGIGGVDFVPASGSPVARAEVRRRGADVARRADLRSRTSRSGDPGPAFGHDIAQGRRESGVRDSDGGDQGDTNPAA